MAPSEQVETIKKLWYELELSIRQDLANIYLNQERREEKTISILAKNLCQNDELRQFLQILHKEHDIVQAKRVGEIFSDKAIARKKPEQWYQEARAAVRGFLDAFQKDINALKVFKKGKHEKVTYSNKLPKEIPRVPRKEIPGQVRIVIVGAGFSGLSTAFFLLKNGVPPEDIVILEKETVGAAASGRSAGFLTASIETDFTELVEEYGRKKAILFWKAVHTGTDLVREVANFVKPGCFKRDVGYLYITEDKQYFKTMKKEAAALTKIGEQTSVLESSEVESRFSIHKTAGALHSNHANFVDSIALVRGMKDFLTASRVRIFENTEVADIDKKLGGLILRYGHEISAEHIVIASSFEAHRFNIPAKIVAMETYLSLTEPLSRSFLTQHNMLHNHLIWNAEDIQSYFTIREDGRMLVGGGAVPIEKKSKLKKRLKFEKDVHELYEWLVYYFPQLKGIRFQKVWSGFIAMPWDTFPVIGREKGTKTYFSVCNGISYCFLSGKAIADLITQGTSDYAQLFPLHRKMKKPKVWFFKSFKPRLFGNPGKH
jgi:gamma-glutamylputrescine oxidase